VAGNKKNKIYKYQKKLYFFLLLLKSVNNLKRATIINKCQALYIENINEPFYHQLSITLVHCDKEYKLYLNDVESTM
jgi:hypothetical protein